jgi:hypothetical protein
MARRKLSEVLGEGPSNTPQVAAPVVEGPSVANNVRNGLAEIPGFAKGALNKVRETTSQPILRFLASKGFKPAQQEMEGIDSFRATHNPVPGEKAGEFAADVGMLMAPLPGGKVKAATAAGKFGLGAARALATGAQGAAQHQAQNYSRTGEIDAGDAALETAATAALMGGGSAAAPALKKGAAHYLQLLTRAPKRLERGMNPPTTKGFEQVLENKMFPIFKGGYREAEKRGIAKQVARDAEKVSLLNASKVRGNAPAAIREAEQSIMGRSAGRKGLLPTQKGEAIAQMGEYRGAYRDPGLKANRFGDMDAESFLDLRKMADQNANFVQGKTPAGLDLASQEFRTAAEKQLSRKMAGKPGEARYIDLKDEMAELAPVLEAFNEKAISNYSLGPEMISTLLGASVGQPWLALAPAARRLPQVAPALYEVGRAAGNKGVKRAGKATLDLGRAASFGREE